MAVQSNLNLNLQLQPYVPSWCWKRRPRRCWCSLTASRSARSLPSRSASSSARAAHACLLACQEALRMMQEIHVGKEHSKHSLETRRTRLLPLSSPQDMLQICS